MSIPLPLPRGTPSREQTEQEGRVLLSSFIDQQAEEEGETGDDGSPADVFYDRTADRASGESFRSRTDALQMNPSFLRLGRELRSLADQFSRSPHRLRVRREAESLDMDTLTRENLFGLMSELFRDGYSGERLVTLFFFCSDLVLRALRRSVAELRWRVVAWVWEFFRDRVCTWVRERGGWEAVLTGYLPRLAVAAAGIAVAAAAIFYVWKHW